MRNLFLAMGVGAAVFAGETSSAQTTQTWNTNTAGSNWSVSGNWSPSASPAGNDLIFGDSFGETSAATTVGNIVDTNFTANSLTYNNTGTSGNFWQVTNINSAITLTLDSAVTPPATIFTVGGTNTNTRAAIQGSGTLTINEATSTIYVGATATAVSALLDMSGLANFNATVATINFGGNTSRGNGDVNLASSNTLTATTLNLGTSTASSSAGTRSDLVLGGTNSINIDTINVGLNYGSGSISFRSGLTNPTVTIRGSAGGTSRADLTIANSLTTALANGQSSTVDFSGSGGSVDALINNLIVGRRADAGTTSSYSGAFTMAKGTFDATTATVGQSGVGGISSNTVTGSLSVSGGSFTAGSLSLANNAGGATSVVSNLNVSGTAAVTVTGNLTAGSKSGTATSVTANINVTGGTLLIQGNLAEGAGAAGVTSTVALSGGTLDMDHGVIQVDTFNQTAGTLKNVSSFEAGTTGGLNLQSASKLAFDIDSGFTTLTLTGSLTLGASSDLLLSLTNGYTPGSSFTLVANDLSDAISGTFATLNGSALGPGNTFALTNDMGTFNYILSYTGGTGNDLVALTVPEPSTYVLMLGALGFIWVLRRNRSAQKVRAQ